MILHCGDRRLDLTVPAVMGVINVTPDSFSDGGRYAGDTAVTHGLALVAAGARVLDIGGESTRPGARPVDVAEELDRILPVVEALKDRTDVLLSVDTRKPEVMRAAIASGAHLINDVGGLEAPGAIAAVAATQVAVCVMHMQGDPRTMQDAPRYDDVVAQVSRYLADRVQACTAAGIARERIVIDPGIGFGKRLAHNLALLAHLPALVRLGQPVLVGVSRKSMMATLLGRPVEQRLAGSLACATAAVLGGASLIRAHDVAETLDAIRVAAALRDAGYRIGPTSESHP